MDPVEMPIDGVLDLHTFDPRQLPRLLDDYLEACREAGIYCVRVIHGKGSGVLRRRVHGLLERNRMVQAYRTAPPEAGGWGATLVELKRDKFVE